MKKLFTYALALIVSVSANAQTPDPSTWAEGQDVTAALGLGDYDGPWSGQTAANDNGDFNILDMGEYWKGSKPSEYNIIKGLVADDEEKAVGAIGFYFDGKSTGELTNMYQEITLPVGTYTVKMQALYREGGTQATFINYVRGAKKKNAWMYVDVLDADGSTVRTFQKDVKSLAQSGCDYQLNANDVFDNSWKYDFGGASKDENNNDVTYYCPQCLVGAVRYFAAGYFTNEMKIVITEEAKVKIGIKKTANIAQDWFVFNNLQVIYEGAANALDLAQMELAEAEAKVDEIQGMISDNGFVGLAGAIQEQLFKIGADDAETLEEVLAVIEKVNALYESAQATLVVANDLAGLLSAASDILASTDFPGKAEFEGTVDFVTSTATTDDYEELGENPSATYEQLYTELSAARANYLKTGDKDENGAWDFTSLIKHPWFVNPEYTPKDTVTQGYISGYQLTVEGWMNQESTADYADRKNGRIDICSQVEISGDETVKNQWFQYINYTAGWTPGFKLRESGHLIGVGDGWNSGLTGSLEIRQQLVGLPAGYYSLKGLLRGQGSGSWSESNLPPYHNIFADNGETCVASLPGHTDSFTAPQWGTNEQQPFAWAEHKTSIIQAPKGELLIGGQSSMIAMYTGFRLMYYGTEPPFNDMIQKEIEEIDGLLAKANITFAGDTLYIDSVKKSIVFPITTAVAYEEAFATTTNLKVFIQKATTAMSGYNTPSDYDGLAGKYEAESAQAQILEPAITFISLLGTDPTDTYEKVADAKAVYNAYNSYLTTFDNATTYGTADIKAAQAAQTAELSKAYASVETLNAMANELNLLINKGIVELAGGANASKENPIDVTALIKNPSFESSPSSGWSGNTPTSNEYAVGNAELWNTNPIDLYQTIQGLPAGDYELHVRALYRDQNSILDNNALSFTSYVIDANMDAEAWTRAHASLYAQTETDTVSAKVKSVCDGLFTEQSFDKWPYKVNEEDAADEEGNPIYDADGNPVVNRDTIWTVCGGETIKDVDDNILQNGVALGSYPFDTKVDVYNADSTEITSYYYPASMQGFYQRMIKSPEAYKNMVSISVAEGQSLRIGFRKNTSVSGDWLIFDDFQLFYLGGDPATAIEKIENNAKAAGIYNLAGQKLAAPAKGINIINGKKVLVK